jgi:hypothetical protein
VQQLVTLRQHHPELLSSIAAVLAALPSSTSARGVAWQTPAGAESVVRLYAALAAFDHRDGAALEALPALLRPLARHARPATLARLSWAAAVLGERSPAVWQQLGASHARNAERLPLRKRSWAASEQQASLPRLRG